MNAKNAKTIGYNDGKIALKHGTVSSREAFIQHGVSVSQRETRVIRTAALYAEGWASAWVEPEPEKPLFLTILILVSAIVLLAYEVSRCGPLLYESEIRNEKIYKINQNHYKNCCSRQTGVNAKLLLQHGTQGVFRQC